MKKLSGFISWLFALITARHLSRRLNKIQFLTAFFIPMLFPIFVALIVPFCDGRPFLKNMLFITILPSAIFFFSWLITSIISRLHDCNYSGWWFIPIALSSHILFGFPGFLLFFWPGTKGINKYGSPLSRMWSW